MISGSIGKWGDGTLRLFRLKLRIGDKPESLDNAYFIEGHTLLENCIVESPVNTAMYVINKDRTKPTSLDVSYSLLNGMEKAQRMIYFEVRRVSQG